MPRKVEKNIVEEFMMENKNKNLSVKTISKRMNIRKKEVLYYIHKSSIIKNVDPLDVGCNAKRLNVYTLT
jgi:hypothetical protein